MKRTSKINKFFVVGAMALGMGLTSCEDFLTVLPSDRITEDDFWKNSADLNNVRASAYRQMTTADVTKRIAYWGELRADNLVQNELTNSNVELLRKGVLKPTDGQFDWSPFYKGINYCNLVLEKGEMMTVPGKEVDPSFRRGDWLPIKAEMLSMRALYYFYLVRAYRNVPFVTHSISTDAEALNSRQKAELGVNILGSLIADLEDAKTYARKDFNNSQDRKGRFTKRAVYALLADLYLWRGCMLENSQEKGDTIIVQNAETSASDTLTTAQLTELKNECYVNAELNCDEVLSFLYADYKEDSIANPLAATNENRIVDFPYMLYLDRYQSNNVVDNVYSNLWGGKNSENESLFELQFDGNVNKNSVYNDYYARYSSGDLKPSLMVGSSELTTSASSKYSPAKGFGKTDVRLLENFTFSKSDAKRPTYHKNIAKTVIISDLYDVTDNSGRSESYRSAENQDANWPVYRLTDVMLIKAEAIARSTANTVVVAEKDNGPEALRLIEGFNLVNSIFQRCNPALKDESAPGVTKEDRKRMLKASEFAVSKKAANLLDMVYNERQLEFIGEGKRWFDLVRQAEASNDAEGTLDKITIPKEVRVRLRNLYSMYVPIYSEELKVNGVEYGGGLVQNPVWDRYTVKK